MDQSPLEQPGPSNKEEVPPQKKERNNGRKNVIYKDCIVITGYPKDTLERDIYTLFKEFGRINEDRVFRFNSNETIVNYVSATAAKKALSMNGAVIRPDIKIKVRHAMWEDMRVKQYFEKSKEKEEIVHPSCLSLAGSFDQQLEEILMTIRLTREEVERLSQLYEDVATVLQSNWPGCRAIPFGSITTGLGVKSSDADCFVEIPPPYYRQGATFVHLAKKAMMRFPKIFTEVFSIPHASTPIVKFHHLPTRTNCDVSFKSPLGTRNSNMIAFFLRLDPRLIPLNILLKYFCKIHDLTGRGKLSNYALTMLIIFYLQQGERPILPSIEYLQRDWKYDFYIDGWNTGYDYTFTGFPPNNLTVKDLFVGFLEFYSEFDFKNLVVCPLIGKPMEAKAFLCPELLSKSFKVYLERLYDGDELPLRLTNCLCIQDPFQLNRNVSSAIGDRLAHEIQEHFKWALNYYKENEKNNEAEGIFLKYILLNKPKIEKIQETPQYKITVKKRVVETIETAQWIKVSKEIINLIFEKLLAFKIVRQESETDASVIEDLTMTCHCRTWFRKNVKKKVASTLDYLDKEMKITEIILETKAGATEYNLYEPLLISMKVKYHKVNQDITMVMKYVSGYVNYYTDLGTFLIEYCHNSFIQIIQVMNKEKLKIGGNEDGDGDKETCANEKDRTMSVNESEDDKNNDSDRKMSVNENDSDRSDMSTVSQNDYDIDIGKLSTDGSVVDDKSYSGLHKE